MNARALVSSTPTFLSPPPPLCPLCTWTPTPYRVPFCVWSTGLFTIKKGYPQATRCLPAAFCSSQWMGHIVSCNPSFPTSSSAMPLSSTWTPAPYGVPFWVRQPGLFTVKKGHPQAIQSLPAACCSLSCPQRTTALHELAPHIGGWGESLWNTSFSSLGVPFCVVQLTGVFTIKKGTLSMQIFSHHVLLRYACLLPSPQHSGSSQITQCIKRHTPPCHPWSNTISLATRGAHLLATCVAFRVPLSPLSYYWHELPPLVEIGLQCLLSPSWC